jgi:hypothetical protein
MTLTTPRLSDETAIFNAGIAAAARLRPASRNAAERVARLLSAALQAETSSEERVPAA